MARRSFRTLDPTCALRLAVSCDVVTLRVAALFQVAPRANRGARANRGFRARRRFESTRCVCSARHRLSRAGTAPLGALISPRRRQRLASSAGSICSLLRSAPGSTIHAMPRIEWHLTLRSRRRPKGRCAPFGPPLMSNVRRHLRCSVAGHRSPAATMCGAACWKHLSRRAVI